MNRPEYYRVEEHLLEPGQGELVDETWCMFYQRIVDAHFAEVNADTHRCEPLSDEEVVIAGLEGRLPP